MRTRGHTHLGANLSNMFMHLCTSSMSLVSANAAPERLAPQTLMTSTTPALNKAIYSLYRHVSLICTADEEDIQPHDIEEGLQETTTLLSMKNVYD